MEDNKNSARVRKWQDKQKSKGLCIECANPSKGLRCDECNKRRSKLKKINYDKWKAENKCIQCGSTTIADKNFCEICYFKRIAHKRLGSSKYHHNIKSLFEKQNGRCALTGDDISFHNMELDHIIPTSKNGGNEISNVRWVTKESNRLKQNLTDEELVVLCNKIIQRFLG